MLFPLRDVEPPEPESFRPIAPRCPYGDVAGSRSWRRQARCGDCGVNGTRHSDRAIVLGLSAHCAGRASPEALGKGWSLYGSHVFMGRAYRGFILAVAEALELDGFGQRDWAVALGFAANCRTGGTSPVALGRVGHSAIVTAS